MIREIVSYTYRYQQKVQQKRKFQSVLRNIEDGTMCVLRNVSFYDILTRGAALGVNYHRLDRRKYRIYPYDVNYGYEGAS